MTKRKHYDVIVAWANGAQIQVHVNGDLWKDCDKIPGWFEWCDYRVKPQKTIQMRLFITKDRAVRVWTSDWEGDQSGVTHEASFSKWLGPVEERTFDV